MIPGRLVLDGLDLLRGAFIRMERHSLDFVARKVLGRGKTMHGEDRAGDDVTSFAVKILMNSLFGVLGTPVCKFFNPEVANAITSFGRELPLWSKRYIEGRGFPVLYGDADSLFVESGLGEVERVRALAAELVEDLNRALNEPTSTLDYEHYLDKQLLPVAGPVLTHLSLDFRRVIGDDKQMGRQTDDDKTQSDNGPAEQSLALV